MEGHTLSLNFGLSDMLGHDTRRGNWIAFPREGVYGIDVRTRPNVRSYPTFQGPGGLLSAPDLLNVPRAPTQQVTPWNLNALESLPSVFVNFPPCLLEA
jgi:hypothetical protein